ncbi:hypothetical protein TA3x_001651 [Tundrisphaera sp. TA3]|uniref:hypothetical protein n=1 Tax=Tundrisphaera sp. TA3 TaxID=3435775 RepID=UPI003EC0476B
MTHDHSPGERTMMLLKLLTLGTTSLLGVALASAMPPGGPDDDPPPPPHKAKKEDRAKKDGPGPGGELRKTYDLLRRLRADGRPAGRPEERLKDWTERSVKLYREAIKASEKGDERRSHELGIAAHDLARAVDHTRNASTYAPDDELPPPPGPGGPEGEDDRIRHDLRRAHERILALADGDEIEAKFFYDASKDLYNAARRDAEAGRMGRAGELARAAEALTHVPEHLTAANDENGPRFGPREKRDRDDRPEPPKGKRDRGDRPEPPREKRDRPRPDGDRELPPPID